MAPLLGRFLAPDPIVGDAADPLAWNAYAYARCNPTSYIDPTGRWSWKVFGAVIATISCGWGQTTTGGAKGVGESTTASVVISLVAIFVVDFFISLTWFQR